ncbi:MAG TPA: hypothetical protein VJB16_03785, partial [archaeon]|nr:hypothetical protein [archaeon]
MSFKDFSLKLFSDCWDSLLRNIVISYNYLHPGFALGYGMRVTGIDSVLYAKDIERVNRRRHWRKRYTRFMSIFNSWSELLTSIPGPQEFNGVVMREFLSYNLRIVNPQFSNPIHLKALLRSLQHDTNFTHFEISQKLVGFESELLDLLARNSTISTLIIRNARLPHSFFLDLAARLSFHAQAPAASAPLNAGPAASSSATGSAPASSPSSSSPSASAPSSGNIMDITSGGLPLITHLEISGSDMREGAPLLTKLIIARPTLHTLVLNDCHLDGQAAYQMFRSLLDSPSRFQVLSFAQNSLGERGTSGLCELVARHGATLRELSVGLSDARISPLLRLLQKMEQR